MFGYTGRCGRAQQKGFTLSLVSPDELKNYRKICEVLNKEHVCCVFYSTCSCESPLRHKHIETWGLCWFSIKGIPPLLVDENWMTACKGRVGLARRLDVLLNANRQRASQHDWFVKNAAEAEMEWDGAAEPDRESRAAQGLEGWGVCWKKFMSRPGLNL